jgi:hypothetical protein
MTNRKFLMLFIILSLAGLLTTASAETLKGKGVSSVSKSEMLPVADVENHNIGLTTREGMVVFENGEVATAKSVAIWDLVRGGTGWAKGYVTYTFVDGSTIMTTIHQDIAPAKPEGAFQSDTKISGEIIKGTGRFEGIKGTINSSTKVLKPEKGEPGGKNISDVVLNYSK